jgi:hypothetical protein
MGLRLACSIKGHRILLESYLRGLVNLKIKLIQIKGRNYDSNRKKFIRSYWFKRIIKEKTGRNYSLNNEKSC